ncbi:MAG: PAS domain-containing protein [Acidobacteriales bacterium]|nr:PAS domain-containing protein [Terriglobales bacterium]
MASYELPNPTYFSDDQILAFVDAIPALAWMATRDGAIFWYNRRWYEYTGTAPEQMKGWGWQSVHDPKILPDVMDRWTSSIRSGEPFEMVFPLRGADGSFRSFLTRVVPVRDSRGDIVRWFGTSTDIDELEHARVALANSEERFRVAVKAVGDIVWTNSSSGEMHGPQPEWQAFTGQSEEELQGFGWSRAVHPEDVEATLKEWKRCVESQQEFIWNHRLRRQDGLYRMFSIRAVPVTTGDGSVREWVGVHTDVTEAEGLERELQSQRELLDVAQAAARAGFWRWKVDSGEIVWSIGCYDIFGVPLGTVITPEIFWDRVHPEDRQVLAKAMEEALKSGEYYVQFRVLKPAEHPCWVAARAKMFRDSGSGPELMGINLDISAEKAREQELQLTSKLIDVAQSAANAGIFRWHLSSDMKEISEDSYRLFEVEPRQKIPALDLHQNVPPEDRDRVLAAVKQARETGIYEAEFRVKRPNGSLRWIAARGRRFHDERGEPYLLGLNIDVTDRKLAEESLLKAEKIAAVGRLAATISHEINNPLEAVTNLLYLAEISKDLAEAQSFIKTAEHELQRVTDIVTQTLRFHRQSSKPRSARLSELLGSVLKLHQPKLTQANIDVRAVYRADDPVCALDGELRQVFANLVGNAVDAMSKSGGKLTIRLSRALPSLGTEGMRVSIADNGHGIAREHLPRLFEAFYTTKGATGSGLGLWVSSEIIAKHHGKIRVRSSRSPHAHGTVFQVIVPFQGIR